jgi:serine/threonine protein kinase
MSPEVMMNTVKQESSTKADVYSFGVIMYEMFFEKMPYGEHGSMDSVIGLSTKVVRGRRPEVPENTYDNVSREERVYLDLMQECWSELPEDRPSFDHIFTVFMDISSGI